MPLTRRPMAVATHLLELTLQLSNTLMLLLTLLQSASTLWSTSPIPSVLDVLRRLMAVQLQVPT